MVTNRARLSLAVLLALGFCHQVLCHQLQAGDWPQILGPNRDGVAVGEKLDPAKLPEKMKAVWQVEIGEGYAGPAVVEDRVILFHRDRDSEVLEARSTKDGASIWKQEFEATYQSRIDPDRGPRAVPVIVDKRVLAWSPSGKLHCVELANGNLVWSRDLFEEYSGDENYFGAASSPLVLGDRVLVNVGGRPHSGIVCVSLETGKTLWHDTDEGTSYSSPIPFTTDKGTIALFVTRLNFCGISPENGQVLFKVPFGRTGPTVNAAIPLIKEKSVFLTASYGIGALALDLSQNPPVEIWRNEDGVSSQYVTPVRKGDLVFACDGREDGGEGDLVCFELATGKEKWREKGIKISHLILVDEHLLVNSVEGELTIVKANGEKFEVEHRSQLVEGSSRSLPALSNGRLYVRTNSARNRAQLFCFDLNGANP